MGKIRNARHNEPTKNTTYTASRSSSVVQEPVNQTTHTKAQTYYTAPASSSSCNEQHWKDLYEKQRDESNKNYMGRETAKKLLEQCENDKASIQKSLEQSEQHVARLRCDINPKDCDRNLFSVTKDIKDMNVTDVIARCTDEINKNKQENHKLSRTVERQDKMIIECEENVKACQSSRGIEKQRIEDLSKEVGEEKAKNSLNTACESKDVNQELVDQIKIKTEEIQKLLKEKQDLDEKLQTALTDKEKCDTDHTSVKEALDSLVKTHALFKLDMDSLTVEKEECNKHKLSQKTELEKEKNDCLSKLTNVKAENTETPDKKAPLYFLVNDSKTQVSHEHATKILGGDSTTECSSISDSTMHFNNIKNCNFVFTKYFQYLMKEKGNEIANNADEFTALNFPTDSGDFEIEDISQFVKYLSTDDVSNKPSYVYTTSDSTTQSNYANAAKLINKTSNEPCFSIGNSDGIMHFNNTKHCQEIFTEYFSYFMSKAAEDIDGFMLHYLPSSEDLHLAKEDLDGFLNTEGVKSLIDVSA